jgi:hypothetical protein
MPTTSILMISWILAASLTSGSDQGLTMACACECPIFTPATAAATSDVIARIRPIEVRTVQLETRGREGRMYKDYWLVVRGEISLTWKGRLADRIEIWTRKACGTRFQVDVDYLVYAHWENGRLHDWSCRTKEFEDAAAEREYLGPPAHRIPNH